MMRNAWLSGVLFLLLTAACGDDASPDTPPAERDGGAGDGGAPADKRAWTFFVYGHGDHNLSNSLTRDMIEMAKAQLDEDVHVVVLADFDATQTIAGTDELFPSGAHWFVIEGGEQEPTLIERTDELNFDDPEVLAMAVEKAFTDFPSERRALVLWDHGGAWNGGFGGDTQDGSASDYSPMSAATVAKAVSQGLAAANIDEPLDLFSFDTCLMAGAEVAFEFLQLAQVYIADAEIDYGDGWDYTGFLTHLAQEPDQDLHALASQEVALWDAHHREAGANDSLLRSHVALSMAKLEDFVATYRSFVDAWLQSTSVTPIGLGLASYFSLPAYMSQLESPGDEPKLRDVGQFLARVATRVTDPQLQAAARMAKSALDDAILARSQGSIRDAAGQTGLHIELPLASAMSSELLTDYRRLAQGFARASRWDDALTVYADFDDGQAPTIDAQIQNAQSPDAAHLPTVFFSSSDADVAEVEVTLGELLGPQTDEVLFYGSIGKGAVQSDTQYAMTWDGQLLTLPDGAGGLQAIYVGIWEDAGNNVSTGEALAPLLATFGMVDMPGGESALGALLFQDGDTETGLLALLDPPVSLSLGDVAADWPGSTFTPLLLSISLSTLSESSVLGTTLPIDSESLPIAPGLAGAGSYALFTSLTDVFGNLGADAQYVTLTQPITP